MGKPGLEFAVKMVVQFSMMTTNEAAHSLAISKLDAAPNARALLLPGEYRINQTVEVSGLIRVGEDYTTAPTVSIPMLETLALFMHYSGATREAAAANLVRAMQTSLAIDGTGAGAIEANIPIINAQMAMVRNSIIGQLPRQNRKGQVTTALTHRQLAAV